MTVLPYSNQSGIDERWMKRALRLASLGFEASPNPMVGCVLLDASGAKVGEGYHAKPGEAHAEANALRQAGGRARGGTAYVTLEPCSHFGRTPPCADALIKAELSRVVVAMTDPDERVRGQGIQRLRAAGIAVEMGLFEKPALSLNRAYIRHRTMGRPLVTLKTAMTLDGRIATVTGDSRWITSDKTRLWVHRQLRARIPAIMVGAGTILADDPSLTVRLAHRPNARNPWRIVVDSHLRTPTGSKVVSLGAKDGKTLIAYVDDPNERGDELSKAGARLAQVTAGKCGRVDLSELMSLIGRELDATGLLVEGGAEIASELIEAGLVDEYICTIGPKIVGGALAPGPVGGHGLANMMCNAIRLSDLRIRRSGQDVILRCEIAQMV